MSSYHPERHHQKHATARCGGTRGKRPTRTTHTQYVICNQKQHAVDKMPAPLNSKSSQHGTAQHRMARVLQHVCSSFLVRLHLDHPKGSSATVVGKQVYPFTGYSSLMTLLRGTSNCCDPLLAPSHPWLWRTRYAELVCYGPAYQGDTQRRPSLRL